MRKTNIWFLNLLFFTGIGLGSCNQADKDSKYITVNVNENYPEKELVLQDFMDVEYIPLETTDEFITQGAVLSIMYAKINLHLKEIMRLQTLLEI